MPLLFLVMWTIRIQLNHYFQRFFSFFSLFSKSWRFRLLVLRCTNYKTATKTLRSHSHYGLWNSVMGKCSNQTECYFLWENDRRKKKTTATLVIIRTLSSHARRYIRLNAIFQKVSKSHHFGSHFWIFHIIITIVRFKNLPPIIKL